MSTKNHIIDKFLIADKLITKKEHDILFKDKDYWQQNSYYKPFTDALTKIIKLQKNNDVIYLSGICFPNYIEFKNLEISPTKNIDFSFCNFYDKANFFGIEFIGKIEFNNTTFHKEVTFKKSIFSKTGYFKKCSFLDKADFSFILFNEKVYFDNSVFSKVSFEHSIFGKESFFVKCKFNQDANFLEANFKDRADFNKSIFEGNYISFTNASFNSTVFDNSTFKRETSFRGIKCEDYCYFSDIVFSSKVEFNQSKFKKNVIFDNTQFENAYFFSVICQEKVSFKNALSNKVVSFENMAIDTIDMTNSNFEVVNFSNLRDKSFLPLKKTNIQNKETARIIKSHLEKQHNIIDANKYFVIEQDKYFDELKWNNNLGSKFVVGLNKLISNHQTNWIKVLLWIVVFSVIVLYFHDGIKLELNKELLYSQLNRAVELINPLNIFKSNDLFKGEEFWAMLVRVITIYLFWQFTVSFRQNTRRK